ncbi:hypothetical protein [Kitasatospora cinereorecta]|uniref:Tetratricopeptide repeat protein n=1 Tax=Kitasatospora cinereorecta TaxID=285560 RepID=A0ABW0VJJ1_9ACTN
MLGPDHPDTLTARSNLARWRGKARDAAGATSAYEQLLEHQLRIMSPDHPEILTTQVGLYYWRSRAQG